MFVSIVENSRSLSAVDRVFDNIADHSDTEVVDFNEGRVVSFAEEAADPKNLQSRMKIGSDTHKDAEQESILLDEWIALALTGPGNELA